MKRKPYRYLLYLLFRLVQPVLLWLPRKTVLALGRAAGSTAFSLLAKERERTLQHLRWAFGHEKGAAEIRELGRRVFIHFGEVAMEIARFPKLTPQELAGWVEPGEGVSRIRQVLAGGKGAIILTAHFGNWELMGAFLRFTGLPGTVIGRKLYYDKFNEMIVRLREKVMLRTIYQEDSPREFLKVLKENEMLGILADQDVDRFEGIFVPFFGRPAYTLTSPVKLALASGAPLVPTFLVREGERYRLIVEEPIQVEMKGGREETIREYTERWTRIVEEKIRQYPDQWVWMHRRWKTEMQPEDEEERMTAETAL